MHVLVYLSEMIMVSRQDLELLKTLLGPGLRYYISMSHASIMRGNGRLNVEQRYVVYI